MKVARILWFAFLASVVVLYVIDLIKAPDAVATQSSETMFHILGAYAIICGGASSAFSNVIWRNRLRKAKSEPAFALGGGRFLDTDEASIRAVQIYYPCFIVAMALSQSVAMFGFVGSYLGLSWNHSSDIILVSMILVLLNRPSQSHVDAAIDNVFGIRVNT